ncbi:MAG: esterase-like activity of phytase family protein [Pseudomonadota bacterium]
MTRLAAVAAVAVAVALALPAAADAPHESRAAWPDLAADGQAVPGGLSGVAVAADGASLLALSDDGVLVAAEMVRDAAGRLLALRPTEVRAVLPPPGADWPDDWFHRDAEGLAVLPDGQIAIAFEGLHRVTLHETGGAFAQWIDVPEDFAQMPVNGGLEGVAMAPDGRLYAIPEAWRPDPTRRPVFVSGGESWAIAAWIEADPPHAPVGLDIDAAGRFYLLERAHRLPALFSSRIRRFEIVDGEVRGLVTLLRTPFGRHGNLEGLSLWTRADGARVATLVSDDNGLGVMRSEIVEYHLPDPDPEAAP